MKVTWMAAGATDMGRRRHGNEDTFRIDPEHGIFLVADGMGGHAAGEVASDIAASTVEKLLADGLEAGATGDTCGTVLRDAAEAAHHEIIHCCQDDPRTRGMGTTLTACILERSGTCHIGHIGDSRLYLLRGKNLEQITSDHTWVQREVDAGRLTAKAARRHSLSHILARVLSEDMDPEIDVVCIALLPGDLLLLATDGLYNMVENAAIASLLADDDAPVRTLVSRMIETANDNGGVDNITVLAVKIGTDEVTGS